MRELSETSFSATSRSRRVSRARYTSPIPPEPIFSIRRYGPNCVPSAIVIVPGLHRRARGQSIVPAVYQCLPENDLSFVVLAARAESPAVLPALERGVFLFGRDQHRQVCIRVLPRGKEVLVR